MNQPYDPIAEMKQELKFQQEIIVELVRRLGDEVTVELIYGDRSTLKYTENLGSMVRQITIRRSDGILLPCAFCGSDYIRDAWFLNDGRNRWEILCLNCNAAIVVPLRDIGITDLQEWQKEKERARIDVISRWNREYKGPTGKSGKER